MGSPPGVVEDLNDEELARLPREFMRFRERALKATTDELASDSKPDAPAMKAGSTNGHLSRSPA